MKNLLILSLLAISGCGDKFQIEARGTIDPEFIPFVQQFINEAESLGQTSQLYKINSVNIIFDDSVKLPELGRCTVRLNSLTIRMNKSAWYSASIESKELRIFHEMGHCILGIMGHRDATILLGDYNGGLFHTNGPASLMNTYEMPAAFYSGNRQYYVQELFVAYISPRVQLFYNGASQFDIKNYVK